uniref:Uncharacterized protein n=1 Tax=Chelydra serpentina TaxID=8475 RepID=A0A8C3XM13_CHESE
YSGLHLKILYLQEIQALEEFREKNQRLQKIWVGRLLLYSSILYLITCLIVYLWYLPDEWTARLIMMLPFFAFPLIVWFIRTVLIFFFSKRTERNSKYLFSFFSNPVELFSRSETQYNISFQERNDDFLVEAQNWDLVDF